MRYCSSGELSHELETIRYCGSGVISMKYYERPTFPDDISHKT